MASAQFNGVEQDHSIPKDGDELPTYDDLAVQEGPNSRFGRWRGWIEKRAAERYVDISPEERSRRRERGWGNPDDTAAQPAAGSRQVPIIVSEPPSPAPVDLHVQTNQLNSYYPPQEDVPLPPLPPVSLKLRPTHLKLHNFGSKFLPHTTSPIHCLLPLVSDQLLLIGHDDGISVLAMYPQDVSETGNVVVKGPEEAEAKLIWRGESVFQMTLLEIENMGGGTPQGVVLLLVGPESDSPSTKDPESLRTMRMYNLASLTSLAKWASIQKGARPVNLRRPSNWHAQQSPVKKHRHQSSIARSLKSLIDSPSGHGSEQSQSASYQTLLSPTSSMLSTPTGRRSRPGSRPGSPPQRQDSDDSSWDMVDDLPLRWATDFVPLATASSRLQTTSVISYAVWGGEGERGHHGRLLAVATKGIIILYEAPKGERAFRYVKDFYTPSQPRKLVFFQQAPQEVSRSASDAGSGSRFSSSHKRADSTATLKDSKMSFPASVTMMTYGPQLCLFILFEKKAGWIRLADSAVGEIELYDDGYAHSSYHGRESSSPTASTTSRKSRMSLEPSASSSTGPGKWILPNLCELPLPPSSTRHNPATTKKVTLLTRGTQTHILPSPLPTGSPPSPPLRIVVWRHAPTSITTRVFGPFEPDLDGIADPPYLQLIGFGENGVEVQEIALDFLVRGKGKGKSTVPHTEDLRAEDDTCGSAGLLCTGGHWDNLQYSGVGSGLNRSYSTASAMSNMSFSTVSSATAVGRMKKEEGVYAWCRKGVQDWRVFWVGGSHIVDEDDFEE